MKVPDVPIWYCSWKVPAVPALFGVNSLKLKVLKFHPLVSVKVKVIDPSRPAAVPARQPIARSEPAEREDVQLWLAPGRFLKILPADAAALLAIWVVAQVKEVPSPVVVDEVQAAHPLGRLVPIESKLSE